MPAELRPAIDTVWVLVSASLIFFMQAGFALIEAGVTSAKNIGNILMKNLMDFVVVAIVFYAAGFAIMFGDGNPFFGTGGWFGDGNPFGALAAAQVPIEAKLLFQLMFAAVAATIVSGAMVERTRFLPYLLACACVGVVIYPVVGHWIWGGGWLAELGFLDFAGSTVVHTTGGLTALAGAVMVGPRLSWRGTGQARRERHQRVPSTQSLYLFVLGTFILWLGWYGFNPGSTLGAVPVTALIALNTTLAGAAGALSAMTVAWVVFGRPDISMSANGALAGLVAITAGCRYVESWAALPIGAVAGAALVAGVLLVDQRVDDPVGAVSVHGIGGVLGTLLAGVFASPRLVAGAGIGRPGLVYGETGQLAVQALGSAVVAAYVLTLAFGMFWLLKRTVGLRASRLAELEGLDVAEHGIVSADPAMRTELEALWGEHGTVADLDDELARAAEPPEDPWAAAGPGDAWPAGYEDDAWPPAGGWGPRADRTWER
jgi:Amt family ammonium transporter